MAQAAIRLAKGHDVQALARAYRERGHVHIRDLLVAEDALALHQLLRGRGTGGRC